MYVRKFEAETMEEALRSIKQELGPDAIILKTVTNKGLKGAFKKSRIEITAAISEKNYTKKAKVDTVLNDEQKERFYSNPASHVSQMIEKHEEHDNHVHSRTVIKNPGYGNMSLNRQVQSVKKIGNKIKNGLDDFLSSGAGELDTDSRQFGREEFDIPTAPSVHHQMIEETTTIPRREETPSIGISSDAQQLIELQRNKIDELEKKLFELTKSVQRIQHKEPTGIYELRTTLRSLDVSESFIQSLIKKCLFELSEDETRSSDTVFEFALREMLTEVKCDMPLFSSSNESAPVVTVLLSENANGQTSMIQKIGALKKDSVIIRSVSAQEDQKTFAEKIFGMEVVQTNAIPEIISQTRKAVGNDKSVFIDYKSHSSGDDDTKKFIDGLRRTFGKVEVLICLSAIHSEIYNRKVVARYKTLSDGMVVTNLDLCLNYGALFNIAEENYDLPFKFYGTGAVIPDDIEAATAERILAGLFRLD